MEGRKVIVEIMAILVFFLIGTQTILPLFKPEEDPIEEVIDSFPETADDPVTPEPYVYLKHDYPGGISRWEVNWSYFKQLFLQHIDWNLEYKRYSYSPWRDGNQYMTIERTWNDTVSGWKFNLILDSPVDVYQARFTLGVDLPVLGYANRSGTEVYINYTVPGTDDVYRCFFNYSDLLGIPNLYFQKGVYNNKWYFRFGRYDIPAGHYEFDPTYGAIADAVIDSWEYEPEEGEMWGDTSFVRLGDSDYYLLSFQGESGFESDGYLRTFRIYDNNGTIQKSTIDSREYYNGVAYSTQLLHVSGDIYALASSKGGAGTIGIYTFKAWPNNGSISDYNIDTDASRYSSEDVNAISFKHLSGDIYVLLYQDYSNGDDHRLETFSIDSNGEIDGWLDHEAVNTDSTANHDGLGVVKVDDDTVACVLSESVGDDFFLYTLDVSGAGAITAVDSWEFYMHFGDGYTNIYQIDEDTFAILYRDTGYDGVLSTVNISSSGAITKSFADTLQYSGDGTTYEQLMFPVGGTIYGITSSYGGDGYVYTVNISDSGVIEDSVIDSMEYSDSQEGFSPTIHLSGDIYANAFHDSSGDGWITTLNITTPEEEEEPEPEPVWTQDTKGWFTFENEMNFSYDKRGFFIFNHNQNYSQDKKGHFLFQNEQNYTQNNLGHFLFSNNLNFSYNNRGFFSFKNNQNHSQNSNGWFNFSNTNEDIFGWRSGAPDGWRTIAEYNVVQLDYTCTIAATPHKDGFIDSIYAYVKYDDSAQEIKAGVYDSSGNLLGVSEEKTVSSNTGEWMQFNFTGAKINVFDDQVYNLTVFGNGVNGAGTIVYTQIGYNTGVEEGFLPKRQSTVGGYPTFPDPANWNYWDSATAPAMIYAHIGDRNFTQDSKGYFTFFNNQNFSQNKKGYFTFENEQNFTQYVKGWFEFDSSKEWTQNKKGFFLFNNNQNFTRDSLGFFLFNNNMNYSQSSKGFFLFENEMNFTQQSKGFFTFYHNLNYTKDTAGFFTFNNDMNYSRDKAGFFTFQNKQNFTQSTKGWFRFYHNINFTQSNKGYFLFNNNQNYSQNDLGWFRFINNLNYTKNAKGWFILQNRTSNPCFTAVVEGNIIRLNGSCSTNVTHYRWHIRNHNGEVGNTTWTTSYNHVVSSLSNGTVKITLEIKNGPGGVPYTASRSFNIGDSRDILPPEEYSDKSSCERANYYWWNDSCHNCTRPDNWDDYGDELNPDNYQEPGKIKIGQWNIHPLWFVVPIIIVLFLYWRKEKVKKYARKYKFKEVRGWERNEDNRKD